MKHLQKKKLFLYMGGALLLLLILSFIILWQLDVFKSVVIHSGYPVRYEYEEMIDRSHLVVRGKITGKSDAITVIPTNGGDEELYTDYYLEISHTLRGDKAAGQTVAVRICGGETLTQVAYDENAPEIKVGDEVVAFLYQLNVGATYTTKGDYYYIVAFDQGWYNLKKDSAPNELFASYIGGEDLVWSDIQVSIPAYTETHPIDYDLTRKEAMQRYESRLKSGEYTKEEYDTMVANLDKYATIKE